MEVPIGTCLWRGEVLEDQDRGQRADAAKIPNTSPECMRSLNMSNRIRTECLYYLIMRARHRLEPD
jgi:hypothetical protein